MSYILCLLGDSVFKIDRTINVTKRKVHLISLYFMSDSKLIDSEQNSNGIIISISRQNEEL